MIKENKVSERNSNFEILRILAMVMIVAHHFSVHSDFLFDSNISINKLFVQFLSLGGKIGVNIFVLISGYFLVIKENIKFNKILKLWLQIFLYSSVFYLVFTGIGYYPFSIKNFIKFCFPIIYNKYWFASSYFIFYLFTPYIHKLVSVLDKSSYKKLLMLMFVCWSLIPTITKQQIGLNALTWFLFLYLLAGYIRLHYQDHGTTKKYLLWATLVYFLVFSITMVLDVLDVPKYATYLYELEKVPILVISVLMVLGFKNIHMEYHRKINILASATFGIYLLHDHEFVRTFLWETFFKGATFSSSSILIPYAIFCILMVYIGCSIVEFIRIYLLEKPLFFFISKREEKIERKKKWIMEKLKLEE